MRGGGTADADDQQEPFRPFSSRGDLPSSIPFIAYASGALALGNFIPLLSPHLLSWLHGFTGLMNANTANWLHQELENCMHSNLAMSYACNVLIWQHCFDHSGSAAGIHAQLVATCCALQSILLTCMHHMACAIIP